MVSRNAVYSKGLSGTTAHSNIIVEGIDNILALLSDPLGAAHRRRSDIHQLISETTLDGNIEREIMIGHQGVVTLA